MMSWTLFTWINFEMLERSGAWITKGVGFKGWYE